MTGRIKEWANHPLAWILSAIGAIVALSSTSALVSGLLTATWMNLGQLFTLVSVGALTLPSHIPPETGVDWLVALVAGGFTLRLAWGIYQTYDRQL